MKRYAIIILALILTALAVILPVFASNTGGFAASVDPAVVVKNQEVTITVNISKFSAVESMAVTFGEPEGLTLTAAQWKQAGNPQNVDLENGRAVWASEKAVNMYSSTDVFELTYQVTDCPAAEEAAIPVEIKVIVEQGGAKFEETLSVTVTVSHTGGEADCENPAKCAECGQSYGEALGHDWADATCTEPQTCKRADCEAEQGDALGHDWADATCENSKTCTVCGETDGDALSHDWEEATCTAPQTCAVCNKIEGKALGHDWTEPTCTDPATCKRPDCGATAGEANGHTPGAAVKENEEEPTCTVDGSYDSVVYCTVCDEEVSRETKTVDALGHTPDAAVEENRKEPDCTTAGSYDSVVYCTVCGEELSRENVPVAALGHTPGAAVKENEVAPTCTADGSYESVVRCTVCGEELSRKTVSVAATGHSYTDTVTEPTCTAQGYTTHTCACGYSYADAYVSALGHDYVDWYTTIEPTCTQDGEQSRHCRRNDCLHYETRKAAAIGHDVGNTVFDKGIESTCLTPGVRGHYKCEVCGGLFLMDNAVDPLRQVTEEELVIPAHVLTDVTKVEPTCTAAGVKAHKKCEGCIKYFIDGVEVKASDLVLTATGHDYDAVVTPPTCTERGYTTYTCHCGDSYTDNNVDANGHAFGNWETTTAATCTEDGEERRDCANCNHYETRKTDATGHSLTQHAAKAATCTEGGWKAYETCGNCDYSTKEETPATGHSYKAVVTAPTCVDKGYTTHTCAACGDSYVDTYVNALGHAFGEWTTAAKPTCTDDGQERRDCANCDHYETRVLDALGHDYESVVTDPTCVAKGYTTHTCACGDSYVDSYVNALDHAYGDWTTTKAATCTEQGQERRDCANCDHFETRKTDATGHKLVHHEAKDATETEEGWYAHDTCENCDYTTIVKIPTKDHSYTSVVTEPTCTTKGYTTHTCDCGHSYVDTYVNALGHNYGDWKVTTEPTCTKAGEERRDCAKCDHYETNTLAALGHKYGSAVTSPTCTAKGYTTYTCSACGDSYKDNYVDELGHAYGDWSTIAKPTCTKDGQQRRDCSRCDAYETDSIAAPGHSLTQHAAKAATCTEGGWKAYETCDNCDYSTKEETPATGHSYTAKVTAPTCVDKGYTTHTCACGHSYKDSHVNELGHAYGAWTTVTAATCTKDGQERHDCSRCDAFETRKVDATGHSHTAVVTAPTCTAKGYTTHTCACGDSYKDSYVNELGHAYGDWTTTKAATCTAEGEQRHDCSRCDAFETRKTPVVGHSYKAVVTAPTCTARGYTTHTCAACGHSYVDTYVEALGHAYGDWTTTKAPNCTEQGDERRDCSRCDAFETRKVDATGHSYTAKVTAPTCTAKGYTTHTCHCGHSYVDTYVDAKGHTPGAAATCTTAQTCTVCGEVVVAALGHTEVVDAAVAATCTTAGKTEGKHCSVCNAVLVEQKEVPATGHQYTPVVTAPTCTEKGYTTHTCSACGASYTSDHKDALGHTDEDGNILCDTCGALLGEIKVELKPEFTDEDVAEELKDTEFDTVEKIEEEMQTRIREELKLPDAEEPVELQETVLYDAVLMYKDEEGELQKADKEHFPEDGKLTVTLPIPEGTDPLTHKYHVVHMFTTSEYGRNPGDVEIFTDLIARPDGNGGYYITFEVTGLSPMMVCVQERHFCEGEHSLTDWYVAVPSTSTEKGELRRHCEECDYYEPKESNLLGDVNGDGKVNTGDAKLIMQYELKLIDETKLDLAFADVNGDGKVNTGDAKLIMQFELGIIDLFPIEKKK